MRVAGVKVMKKAATSGRNWSVAWGKKGRVAKKMNATDLRAKSC